jgi:hypothetical protein
LVTGAVEERSQSAEAQPCLGPANGSS